MSHALVTIIAPLRLDRVAEAEEAIDRLGNPAQANIQEALNKLDADGAGTHFASLHAIRSADAARAYLVFEFSADGAEDQALARILGAIGEHLRPIFMLATDWRDGGKLDAYLSAHQVKAGGGWFDNPGLAFAGTPGLTVGQIRVEAELARKISDLLAGQSSQMPALERIEDVRKRLDPSLAVVLRTAMPQAPYEPSSGLTLAIQLVLLFSRTYLWPLGLALLAWSVYAGFRSASLQYGFGRQVEAFLVGVLGGLWTGFWWLLLGLLIVAGLGYAFFRRAEARDAVDERAPDRATNAALFERENHYAQNHMISVTQRKPGLLRAFASRLIFWAIGELATRVYPPGFLGDISTIHFARWVTAPRSPDLIFLSNYDSSWESYLEDFITRAHAGLTGVWSNSIGFPRAENLIGRGATDGERFKRYARRSMSPTRFWYSAYPTLTTTAIRTNSDIRRGLSGAMTEDEAKRWLALFGSAPRPPSKLVSNEIQSLIFGGLIFMPQGTCLLFDLPADRDCARQWLSDVCPHIAFNDGRRLRESAVVTLALGSEGLARLGLPAESLETFPFAFLQGMTGEGRARMLGDIGENGSEFWRWGRTQPHVALVVYGASEDAVERLAQLMVRRAKDFGATNHHRIPLETVRDKEPFGFADGLSQPVIRGTYKALRVGDPIHEVEPGEFILGYPDNRGNLPPGPTMPATADPENHLPLVGASGDFGRTMVENTRDVGFNGSFLVIRELEQDTEAFWAYCEQEADRLAGHERLPPPYVVTKEFIAAKLIGRWPDGSSLVRHPYEPAYQEKKNYEKPESLARKMKLQSTASAQVIPQTTRLDTNPDQKPGIEPAAEPAAENDYLFGTEDPEALRCPFGAHVRRANPRESFDPGSADQIAISNRHRIIRVGRQYKNEPGENPGILFMCLNGDIERQFEFVQQTWLRNPSFHGLSCEKDSLLGNAEVGACSYTIPTRDGPVRLSPMPRFVRTRGGGYFFLPGKRLIEYLSAKS